ncbi:hypothetical protein LCGC14_1132210 [marine sediment metagenome]|uniref:Uncharacterized protein n=1 Tax=marine sediment metagenome TaxID=412755 RepID=A0A0F9Q6J3_9ZZZZ
MTITTKKIILNNEDDVQWFINNFPNGSFSWLFTMLLNKFREACEEGKTPADLALLGARELRKELDGE